MKKKCPQCNSYFPKPSNISKQQWAERKFCSHHCQGKYYAPSLKIFQEGKNSPYWKGQAAGYQSLHEWVVKHLGKPDTCEHCGRSGLSGRFIQWANKSGKYLRKLDDWIRLCTKCHHKYDNISEKVWQTRRKNVELSKEV